MTPEQLKVISQISCGVLSKMGSQIQWVHSYVTTDKIYCVYNAPNEEMVDIPEHTDPPFRGLKPDLLVLSFRQILTPSQMI